MLASPLRLAPPALTVALILTVLAARPDAALAAKECGIHTGEGGPYAARVLTGSISCRTAHGAGPLQLLAAAVRGQLVRAEASRLDLPDGSLRRLPTAVLLPARAPAGGGLFNR